MHRFQCFWFSQWSFLYYGEANDVAYRRIRWPRRSLRDCTLVILIFNLLGGRVLRDWGIANHLGHTVLRDNTQQIHPMRNESVLRGGAHN